jgi:glycosyltransferase involved in cell wall biosynthesis
VKGTGILSRKINVLHIVQHATGGGIIRQLFNLLRSYDKDTIQPMVCCMGSKGTTGKLIEESGIDFMALNIGRNDRLIPRAVRLLYVLMKERHIHVVRTHGHGANLNGRIAAGLCGIPCIPSVHNVYRKRKERKLQRRIANNLLGRISDRVIAVSEAVREDVIRYDRVDPSKVFVIRNGVDTELFSPAGPSDSIRRELALGDNDTVIGFVGRLVPAKGLAHLIEAFAEVRKEIDHVKILIVGRGALLSSLQKMAVEKGLQDDIIFAGERSDIPRILSLIDIFAMSSEQEGLPNALLEAMSAARPSIVTSAGGMKEVVQDGVTGLVVPINDPVALSRAMKRLITDKESSRAMGRAAREYIEKNFSILTTARVWEDLYRELLKKESGAKRHGKEALT